MPLVSLDHIRMAYGHLPLLDDASLLIEAGERVCVIGRNGTGKSTLLQIIGGEVTPDAGTVWRQPGLRIARLEQDVPLSTDRPVREVVADGFKELAHVDRWHVDVSVDMVISTPRPSCRRDRVDAVRRMAPPGPACARAGGAARCAAARRADEPSRHRGDDVARVVSRGLPGSRCLRHARPRLPAARRHAHRRARSRPADVVARQLRDFSREERRVARQRADPAREVRQEARAGRGVAAAGHQGPAHARRRAREGADGDAERARRTARPDRPGPAAGRVSRSFGPDGVRGERPSASHLAARRLFGTRHSA